MNKLYDKLCLPKGHYHLHRVVLSGLSVSVIAHLARELGRSPAQVAEWIGVPSNGTAMSLQASEIFCRLVDTLDELLALHDGNLEGALQWLTTPNLVLANERPVDLLVTGPGTHAVHQVIHAIEYGLPV